jgi:hypothetical protein
MNQPMHKPKLQTSNKRVMKRKKSKPYTPEQLVLTLDTAIREMEGIYLDDTQPATERIKAASALTTLVKTQIQFGTKDKPNKKPNKFLEFIEQGGRNWIDEGPDLKAIRDGTR